MLLDLLYNIIFYIFFSSKYVLGKNLSSNNITTLFSFSRTMNSCTEPNKQKRCSIMKIQSGLNLVWVWKEGKKSWFKFVAKCGVEQCASFTHAGGTPTSWKTAKNCSLPTAGKGNPNAFTYTVSVGVTKAPVSWYLRHKTEKHYMGSCFHSCREKTEQEHFLQGLQLPHNQQGWLYPPKQLIRINFTLLLRKQNIFAIFA